MSDENSSAKMFPYLVLQNTPGSPEKVDGVCSSRERGHIKREAHPRIRPKIEGQDTPYSSSSYLSFIEDPLMSQAVNPNTGQVPFNDFNTLNSISMTQMRAILTAQKELRKPAGSLYPTASQISLIPETEMIYKKYFPVDGNETAIGMIPYNRNKSTGKDKLLLNYNNNNSDYTGSVQDERPKNSKRNDNITKRSVTASISESNIANNMERNHSNSKGDIGSGNSGICSSSVSTSINGRKAVSNQRDADTRFKKRVQSQLVSLCTEVERQSSDMIEMRRELKDLLALSRKNSTGNDSSKSRLDMLSKHVHEIDNKMDTLQESISAQEKNLLGKLMLIGELSDSDSDLDESVVKGIDTLSSPSSTRLSILSSTKRPVSSGSLPDNLPKFCCNWVPIAPDFDKLLQAVALLNYRMDRNQSMKLCNTNNGATFKHCDVIDLTIFKNGMILGSSGFRSYSTMSVIRFVNEIFNGYLPTELTTQYPDGVVIVLNDKRSVLQSCDENFNGLGTKLSAKDLPDILPGMGINVLQKKDSMESIRPRTATSLVSLASSSVTRCCISNYEMLPDLILVGENETDGEKEKRKVIILKVNDRKSGNRFKVKIPVNATVKNLSDHLGKVIAEREGNETGRHSIDGQPPTLTSYHIILPVPHGKLSCTSSTLEDYGLIQNSLVYIEEKSS